MPYVVLPDLLEQEGLFFSRDNRWKPTNLVPANHSKAILRDVQKRLARAEEGEPEFKKLDRSTLYLNALKRMRFSTRQAMFAWRADDLKFLQAVTEFYSDYGTVLRLLAIDKGRGKFIEPSVGV